MTYKSCKRDKTVFSRGAETERKSWKIPRGILNDSFAIRLTSSRSSSVLEFALSDACHAAISSTFFSVVHSGIPFLRGYPHEFQEARWFRSSRNGFRNLLWNLFSERTPLGETPKTKIILNFIWNLFSHTFENIIMKRNNFHFM